MEDAKTTTPLLRLFFTYWKPFKVKAVVGPIFKILEVVCDLIVPLLVARMVDKGVLHHDPSAIWHLGIALIVMALLGFACTVVCQYMASVTSQGMGGILRDEIFQKVVSFGKLSHDRFGSSSLATRITSDINQVQVAIALGIRQLIRWPILAIGSVVAALMIDLKLGCIFLITTPLVGLAFWFVISHVVPYFYSIQALLDKSTSVTLETLNGIRPIRANLKEGYQLNRFQKIVYKHARLVEHSAFYSAFLNPITLLILDLGICAILQVSAFQVDAGALQQGQVLAFVNYMTQTLLAVGYVANLVVIFTKGSASAGRILYVLNCPDSISYGEKGEDAFDKTKPVFTFDQATFTFPDASGPAINSVSFSTTGAHSIGIIGATGSGKTTLVNLMAHLFEPQTGTVSLFGNPIQTYSKACLNKAIGYIDQTPALAQGTVAQNLRWRKPDASDTELEEALKAACVTEFLPEGAQAFDATVDILGTNFSGGQRQRLSIARALVGKPDVLILDAATSSLDMETEAKVMQGIRSYLSDSFLVVVSERVRQVAAQDMILVLDQGSLVGVGTHEELLQSCEVYKSLAATQLMAEQEEM